MLKAINAICNFRYHHICVGFAYHVRRHVTGQSAEWPLLCFNDHAYWVLTVKTTKQLACDVSSNRIDLVSRTLPQGVNKTAHAALLYRGHGKR